MRDEGAEDASEHARPADIDPTRDAMKAPHEFLST